MEIRLRDEKGRFISSPKFTGIVENKLRAIRIGPGSPARFYVLNALGDAVVGRVKSSIVKGRAKEALRAKLQGERVWSHTDNLKFSYDKEVQIGPGLIYVFTNLSKAPQGRILELGGTIHPFRAKMLFIPLKNGVRPLKSRIAQRLSGWIRGVDFVLVKEVKIEPRHIMGNAIEWVIKGPGKTKLEAMIGTTLEEAWNKANE